MYTVRKRMIKREGGIEREKERERLMKKGRREREREAEMTDRCHDFSH